MTSWWSCASYRPRTDLWPIAPGDQPLRAQLLEYFPALERAFDYSKSKAALILLTATKHPRSAPRRAAHWWPAA